MEFCSSTLECFSNDDGHGNEKFNKSIRLNDQNNNSARALHFFVNISLPSLHDYDVKFPDATFYGGRKHTTTNF